MSAVIRAFLFDLDNTLYPVASGLVAAGDVRITDYIAGRLKLPRDEADALRVRTWREYGATARGLAVEFGLDPAEMYAYAIDTLDPRPYLQPAPKLAAMLHALPAPSYVLTNASARYAGKVLEALGIAACITEVFDISVGGYVSKPDPAPYHNALARLRVAPQTVVFVDDTPHNLRPAQELGMKTVLVGEGPCEEADACVPDLLDLPAAIGRLEPAALTCSR
jgi:putative hydrolase of the HAD superfamily